MDKKKSRKKTSTFFNRELSWLEFNQRVLECSADPSVPVLERLKFLSITASNLDEFFMVRVGGLHMLFKEGIRKTDSAGMTPLQQLTLISYRVQKMINEQYHNYTDSIIPELEENEIVFVSPLDLNATQLKRCEDFFESEIFPVLSPVSLSDDRPFPLTTNKMLYFLLRTKDKNNTSSKQQYTLLRIPRNLNRFITLPSVKGLKVILLEDCIALFMHRFLPGMEIKESVLFRINRNADLKVDDDLAPDLMAQMETIIDARNRSDCIRLEITEGASRRAVNFLQKKLGVSSMGIYKIKGPLDYAAFMPFATMHGFDHLQYKEWKPQLSPLVPKDKSIFSCISRKDLCLYHPYESFEPVLRFLSEAADDPDVIAIKQTLYRTSGSSPIITALKRAAENGKSVTVLVELKARFDEERNIEWAKQLEDEGVHVIYGIKKLKTHAKICIIVRREPQGIRRYIHFGTGNYNEKTATLYGDISYMTADEDLGFDASSFFNVITGYSRPQKYRKMESAPLGLRDKIIEMIEGEIERKKEGNKTFIMAKLNSLDDTKIIKALYKASQAGIPIDLNVRGICCLKPGIKGKSENITVKSIVDRFLEHSRIFYFFHGGVEPVYISSADWMPRNLDKRIEQLVPVDDPASKKRIISFLKTHMADTVNAWILQPDGTYIRIVEEDKKKRIRSQEAIYRSICKVIKSVQKNQPVVFEPFRSPKTEL